MRIRFTGEVPPPVRAEMPCANCKQPLGAFHCGRCQSEFYCSVICQKERWPLHRPLCTALFSARIEPSPPESKPPRGIKRVPTVSHKDLQFEAVVPPGELKKLIIFAHPGGRSPKDLAGFAGAMEFETTLCLLISGPIKTAVNGQGAFFVRVQDSGGIPIPVDDPRRRASLFDTRALLSRFLKQLFTAGWAPKDVFLVGLGQGGTALIDFILSYEHPLAGAFTLEAPVMLERSTQADMVASCYSQKQVKIHNVVTKGKPSTQETIAQVAMFKKAGFDINSIQIPGSPSPGVDVTAEALGELYRSLEDFLGTDELDY